MELASGQMLAHYRLVEKIGEGGMGMVWRAVDTTLDREAAIKVLPQVFASDRERLLRFEREAKVLASLNHPGIASIFGLHEADAVRFLAMEYVPGENLADRLARGPIAMDQALDIARQIAEAIEAAHELGVIHRDLKPANVVVTPTGQVKVLDFGLARALVPEAVTGDMALSMSPTITTPATMMGTILGTAAYMSPEQARGGVVDKRADIWALGCVLMEMLTGKRAFDGGTVTDTLAAVLRADLDLDALPRDTPARVRHLLERCLDRDARTRLRDAGEARIVLSHPAGEAPEAVQASQRSRTPVWIALAVVALGLGLGVGHMAFQGKTVALPAFAFRVTVEDQRLRSGSIALSPDGRNLVVHVQRPDGRTELWLRPLGENRARPLPGTVGGSQPFWSPDSREIAFFADGHLLRLPIDGTSPRVICAATQPVGGAWNQHGVILVGQEHEGLHRVDANGGNPVPVTTVRPDEEEHAWPAFLPDGDHFVFLADANTTEAHRVCLSQLSSGEITILKTGVRSSVGYDPRVGVLLGERQQLVAYPLDLAHRALGSQSLLVVESITPLGSNHETPFSISRNGILATQHGMAGFDMVRVDLEGRELWRYGDEVERIANPALSPDGRRVVFEVQGVADERLIWMLDLERGVRTSISQRNSLSDSGAWSADGGFIYFDSDYDSTLIWSVYKQAADGGGQPVQVGRPEGTLEAGVLQCSRDGQWLLVYCILDDNNQDLYVGRLDSDGMVTEWSRWTTTPQAKEAWAAFSPDGRFIVYASDASGQSEVYLAPFEGGPTRNRWQVSTHGGVEPRFDPEGKSIYYVDSNDRFMTVSVALRGDEVTLGAPAPAFEARQLDIPYYRNSFDVFPDGSILILRPVDDTGAAIEIDTAWYDRP